MMIVVECYSDEYLIKSMGFPRKKIKHGKSKGNVVDKVKNGSRIIGMIDEDPESAQPSDLKNYVHKKAAGNIKLLVRNNDNHRRIIQISPRLEEWLLHRAKMNQISPKDFNLPADPNKFHSLGRLERKKNFQSFIKKLAEADEEMKIIRKWINELLE